MFNLLLLLQQTTWTAIHFIQETISTETSCSIYQLTFQLLSGFELNLQPFHLFFFIWRSWKVLLVLTIWLTLQTLSSLRSSPFNKKKTCTSTDTLLLLQLKLIDDSINLVLPLELKLKLLLAFRFQPLSVFVFPLPLQLHQLFQCFNYSISNFSSSKCKSIIFRKLCIF